MGEDMMDYTTVGVVAEEYDGRTTILASVTADSQWEALGQATWLLDTREGNKLLFGDSPPSEIVSDVVQGGLEASS